MMYLDSLLAMKLLLQLQQLSHEASIGASTRAMLSHKLQRLLQRPVLSLHQVGQGQCD